MAMTGGPRSCPKLSARPAPDSLPCASCHLCAARSYSLTSPQGTELSPFTNHPEKSNHAEHLWQNWTAEEECSEEGPILQHSTLFLVSSQSSFLFLFSLFLEQ